MPTSSLIRVVQLGFGDIGRRCARIVLARSDLHLVGVVDHAPDLAGRPLVDVLGVSGKPPITIRDNVEHVLEVAQPHVVIQASVSRVPDVLPQIAPALARGVSVVTSAEEMTFPWHRHPDLAERIAATARQNGARVVGAGVNPGFVLDFLPAVLAQAVHHVRRVRAARVVDAATRRAALQRKVGAGLSEADFRQRARENRIGHVGLAESAALLAHALGWKLDSLEETIEPVLARTEVRTDVLTVARGAVAGIHQRVRGVEDDVEVLSLDLQMFVGAEDPHDRIQIDAEPPIDLRISGGLAGDDATAACLVNAVPRLLTLPAGLWTVADLPPIARQPVL